MRSVRAVLHLGRLRLLRELSTRGIIAAVADALQFTPSAVSQQLAILEREASVPLLERVGRGVRLTDAALVLVGHAGALLDRAAEAETPTSRQPPARYPGADESPAFKSALHPDRAAGDRAVSA
jgi:DNA-binding transcriptional LysR family regulator